MKIKAILTILFFLIFNFIGRGQEGSNSISGRVVDNNGISMESATAYLSNTGIGAITNKNGEFRLDINSLTGLDTLTISFVGFSSKKIAINFEKQKKLTLEIKLSQLLENLNEVILTEGNVKAKRIIKKAIKNIQNNYLNEPINLKGFYREIGLENNECVELNESVFHLNYSVYPQRINVNNASDTYWSKSSWSRMNSIFYNDLFFEYYISPNDSLQIRETRISQNNSISNANLSPLGGQFNLIALDKVKYLYDFLDPKVIKKYSYEFNGYQFVDNVKCYALGFSPIVNKRNKPIKSRTNWKMKRPLYEGVVYVSTKNFAVQKIEGNLSSKVKFGNFYKNLVADYNSFTIEYSLFNEKMCLSRVSLTQIKKKSFNNKNFDYKSIRDLILIPDKERTSNENILFTSDFTLRENIQKYNEKFWKNFEYDSLYLPIEEHVMDFLQK